MGHLSHENNTHELALKTVKSELKVMYDEQLAEGLDINVAPQDALSKLIEI